MYPLFSRNGTQLFFEALDNRIMVSAYRVKGDSFMAARPRVWSEQRLAGRSSVRNFDLAPDGKHIAALMPADAADVQSARNHVMFLENFFDELRRKLPASK
jgi:hypothetical protein